MSRSLLICLSWYIYFDCMSDYSLCPFAEMALLGVSWLVHARGCTKGPVQRSTLAGELV